LQTGPRRAAKSEETTAVEDGDVEEAA
jgi:hypothetical protein